MDEHERISRFLPLMQSLYGTAKEKLGFEPHVKIFIIKNDENMTNPLGKTAHYSPSEHKIGLFTKGRHIKDILRSLSHELVHHNQNCRGDFDNGAATVQGYAQEDGHLREMEREAYECGNMIFRDWEDKMKEKGAKPLFTTTKQYVRPMMTDVVGGRLLEENKMKQKVNESHLRNIIRGVIQEMFDDDLNEADNMGMPANAESQEAAEEEAEKSSGQVGAVYKGVEEGFLGKMAGKALKGAGKLAGKALGGIGKAAVSGATEKAKEIGAQAVAKGAEKVQGAIGGQPAAAPAVAPETPAPNQNVKGKKRFAAKKAARLAKQAAEAPTMPMEERLFEDSEGEETEHYGEDEGEDRKEEENMEDHMSAIDHHLDALKRDMGYDESHEDRDEEGEHFRESFFPQGKSIREIARHETYGGLLKKWGYHKKEK